MAQPSFVPVTDSGAVRATVPARTPSIGRAKKAGLLGRPTVHGRTGQGSPGPDAGYALTLASRALTDVRLEVGEQLHDVELGVALLAAKRAALSGRGPTMSDVTVALDLFGFRATLTADELAHRQQRFAGLGHSYALQRAFVDSVAEGLLSERPGTVVMLSHATQV